MCGGTLRVERSKEQEKKNKERAVETWQVTSKLDGIELQKNHI